MRAMRFHHQGTEMAVLELEDSQIVMPETFTPNERQVALLVVDGLSSAEIANRRGTSVRTIANQLQAIYRKAGVTCRADLVIVLGGGAAAQIRTRG